MKTRSAFSRQKVSRAKHLSCAECRKGGRRVENLKTKANLRLLVACAKYELQMVSESTRLAAEERERNIDEERRKIDGEARERAEVPARRWREALAKVTAKRQCSPMG